MHFICGFSGLSRVWLSGRVTQQQSTSLEATYLFLKSVTLVQTQ